MCPLTMGTSLKELFQFFVAMQQKARKPPNTHEGQKLNVRTMHRRLATAAKLVLASSSQTRVWELSQKA